MIATSPSVRLLRPWWYRRCSWDALTFVYGTRTRGRGPRSARPARERRRAGEPLAGRRASWRQPAGRVVATGTARGQARVATGRAFHDRLPADAGGRGGGGVVAGDAHDCG